MRYIVTNIECCFYVLLSKIISKYVNNSTTIILKILKNVCSKYTDESHVTAKQHYGNSGNDAVLLGVYAHLF